jgi:gliding motility-associated lipoprotein GldD
VSRSLHLSVFSQPSLGAFASKFNCFRGLSLTLACCCLLACNSTYTPKRKGYFKIDFPPHEYQTFNQPGFPYTFDYPVYASIARDSSFFDTVPENPYWININFPRFGATIYISYKDIGTNTFDKLRDDAFKMTYKHTYKASSIQPTVIQTPNGIGGIFFTVGGNAATAQQFYLSDTTRHFLRGALYFDTTPNEDSLGIVNKFLQKDLTHLINTFQWKNNGPIPPSQRSPHANSSR